MPYAVKGSAEDGGEFWLSSKGNWVPDKRHAGEFREPEAHMRLAAINMRNQGLDPEDRITPSLEGGE